MSPIMDEAQLRAGLESSLRGVVEPSLLEIETRAHTKQHRRNRVALIGSATVSVLALTAAGTFHIVGWEPTTSGEVPICTASEVAGSSVEAFPAALTELPDGMALTWRGEPTAGYENARRVEHTCAWAPFLVMKDLHDGAVTRTVDIAAFPVGPDGSTPWDMDPESTQTDIRTYKGDVKNGEPFRRATWTDGGYWYMVEARGVAEEDLSDLLGNLVVDGEELDTSAWTGLAEFDVVDTQRLPRDGTSYNWILATSMHDGEEEEVPVMSMDVSETQDPLILSAQVGDRQISVNGEPALQSPGGSITWKPSPTLIATLSGSASNLLAYANTVGPLGTE